MQNAYKLKNTFSYDLLIGNALTVDDCPDALPRDEYLQVYNDLCYQFVTYRLRSWNDAVKECETAGGALVMIKDWDTNIFIEVRRAMGKC